MNILDRALKLIETMFDNTKDYVDGLIITLSDNLVSNGDFATGDWTDWDAHGAEWSIENYKAKYDGYQGSSDGTITQNIDVDHYCIVFMKFTISGVVWQSSDGYIGLYINGSTDGVEYKENGTYTLVRYAGTYDNDIEFRVFPSLDADAENHDVLYLDDIIVKKITDFPV